MARSTGFISRRSVLAAATLLALWSPASAQTTGAAPSSPAITSTTDCDKYQEAGKVFADLKCEEVKGQILRRDGQRIDREGQKIDQQGDCLEKLLAFKKAKPAEFRLLGRITKDNACAAAGRISANGALNLGDGG